ncbi:hypothetical protein QL285_059924 [Trifolium repens]|nr:hypothetical protein QL285_059924 [Trifolium repens]
MPKVRIYKKEHKASPPIHINTKQDKQGKQKLSFQMIKSHQACTPRTKPANKTLLGTAIQTQRHILKHSNHNESNQMLSFRTCPGFRAIQRMQNTLGSRSLLR